MTHQCHVVIVCCIDFRFQNFIRQWTAENLKDQTFDLVGFAGSTKELETVLGQIDISVRLHHISQVVLIHHEDCGAYGVESTFENHSADLYKAKAAILARYPSLSVSQYYLKLSGEFIPV